MKKIRKSVLLLVVLCLVMSVAGCGNAKIVGKWYETTGLFGSYEFFEDGTCTYESQNMLTGEMDSSESTYKFRGKKGTISAGDAKLEFVLSEDEITLYTSDDFSMTLTKEYVEPTLKDTMDGLHDAYRESLEADFERETGMTVEEYDEMKAKEEEQEALMDPMYMTGTMLVDPQWMTGGVPEGDMGEDFAYVAVKQTSDDGSYVTFGSDDEGAYFGRNELLNYGNRNNNQAILFKFDPKNATNLQFTLMNDNEMVLRLDGYGLEPQNVNVHQCMMTGYSTYADTGFNYKEGCVYWGLMAVDGEGRYRAMVWQADDPSNMAVCQDDTGIVGGDWKWVIGFDANQSIDLYEYSALDFDQFADMDVLSE